MTQKLTNTMLTGLTADKLTGTFNAISGENLTGFSVPQHKSASDPTISSNMALGTMWVNYSNGSVYICTSDIAGNNYWKNIGSGTGDIS
jgi:hypothetical protein